MTTSSTRIQGLLSLFDYHTGFLPRALEGLSNEDLHNRLHTEANHPAWIAGSAVHQRFLMAKETGSGLVQTGGALFNQHQGIQADARYPSVAEYLADWERVTPEAREALVRLDDAKLDGPFDMGGTTMPFYNMICFTIYREASLIGQLALWRRLLGKPGMRYD